MFLMKLPPALWRALVVALGALTIGASALTLVYFAIHVQADDFGALGIDQFGRATESYGCRSIALKVDPDGAFAAAGGKAGDRLCLDRELDLQLDHLAGYHVPMTVWRGSVAQRLDVVLHRADLPSLRKVFALMQPIAAIFSCVVGMLIGLRAADRADLRLLSLGMLLFSLLEPTCMPEPAAQVLVSVFRLFPLYPAFLFDFAIRFPDNNPQSWRKRMAALVPAMYVIAMLVVGATLANLLGIWQSVFVSEIKGAYNFLAAVLVGVALVAGRAEASGDARARFAWMLPAFLTIGSNVYYNVATIFPSLHAWWASICVYLISMVFPAGLAYATLKHRVFDFSLAVNRALVYTIVSSLLLIVFGVTEFAVDKLLHFHGRQANIIVDAAVALAVILTFHRIQHWISHRVDHTFYHHWQEAAQRLTLFVEKTVHISSAEVLQTRFIDAVDQFGGAAGSALYARDAAGSYRRAHASLAALPLQLDADDELLLTMRSQAGAVQLADAGLPSAAALALPMTVRGQLDGLLLVGPKRAGTTYRPDEIALLATAAQRVAHDLDSLCMVQLDRNNAAMAKAIEQLRHANEVAVLAKEKAELALSLHIASA